jgi:hypothetical protein
MALRSWWAKRRDRRRWVAETLVAAALRERAESAEWPLMQRTGLSGWRLYATLGRLESRGQVDWRWADEPTPRRRLFRLVEDR